MDAAALKPELLNIVRDQVGPLARQAADAVAGELRRLGLQVAVKVHLECVATLELPVVPDPEVRAAVDARLSWADGSPLLQVQRFDLDTELVR